jgi:hypothetical protein
MPVEANVQTRMSSEAAVREGIERAYCAFGGNARPQSLAASPLRDRGQLEGLISRPLRQLAGEIVGPYAGWAMTTVGSAQAYRYFLPRILELAVCGGGWVGTDPPVIAQKLLLAEWTMWSAPEREAVIALFDAAFRWTVQRHIDFTDEAPLWLCGLALLQQPVTALLADWRQASSAAANLQLVQFFLSAEADLQCGRLRDAWWENVPEAAAAEIAAWLVHGDTKAQIMAWRNRVSADDRWMFDSALCFWPAP